MVGKRVAQCALCRRCSTVLRGAGHFRRAHSHSHRFHYCLTVQCSPVLCRLASHYCDGCVMNVCAGLSWLYGVLIGCFRFIVCGHAILLFFFLTFSPQTFLSAAELHLLNALNSAKCWKISSRRGKTLPKPKFYEGGDSLQTIIIGSSALGNGRGSWRRPGPDAKASHSCMPSIGHAQAPQIQDMSNAFKDEQHGSARGRECGFWLEDFEKASHG